MHTNSIFFTQIPRSETTLMQHLLRLVGPGNHRYYICGACPLLRLIPFLEKMAARYPLTRNARGRSYDRQRGHAAMHLVVYPLIPFDPQLQLTSGVLSLDARGYNTRIVQHLHAHIPTAKVAWWIVSSDGKNGLNDPSTPDHSNARDAMRSESHLVFGDYVLLYAHKQAPREIPTGKGEKSTRTILEGTSTWTWKIRKPVLKEVLFAIKTHCADLDLGHESDSDSASTGLLGLLAAQRTRPLFSGVRNQVIEIEREARRVWRPYADRWRSRHRHSKGNREKNGTLKSVNLVMEHDLPLMVQIPTYADPPLLIRDILPPYT